MALSVVASWIILSFYQEGQDGNHRVPLDVIRRDMRTLREHMIDFLGILIGGG